MVISDTRTTARLLLLAALWTEFLTVFSSHVSLAKNRGDTLVSDRLSDVFLVSDEGTFKAGFYPVGENAVAFAVWFAESVDPNRTVVWMANRDLPVNGQNSRVSFLSRSGDLELTDTDDSVVWSTNASSGNPTRAELMESGNLVLMDAGGKVVWQSFEYPTDTLLAFQTLTKTTRLVSRKADGSYGSGYYRFYFSYDGVLRFLYDGPRTSSFYWPYPDNPDVFQNGSTRYNSTRNAFFDDLGRFTSSDKYQFSASDAGVLVRRRLTMDFDGVLRLYSLNNITKEWAVSWVPELERCRVHGLCGENGICFYAPEPSCTCPPGFEMNNPADWSEGCRPTFKITCNKTQVDFVELPHTDFYGYDLSFKTRTSLEACKNICISDCNCVGFSHRLNGDGLCYSKILLLNGQSGTHFYGDTYIKVPRQRNFSSNYLSEQPISLNCSKANSTISLDGSYAVGHAQGGYLKYPIEFVIAIGIVEVICVILGWAYLHEEMNRVNVRDGDDLALMTGFRRFTYKALKAATKNFSDEIGRGGSGAVYKGVLDDGRVVAVKRLEGVQQGEAQFWSEVSIIGRINHMNLVTMLGFCAEKENRLLVYEYMENGSLEKNLFVDPTMLTWEKRLNIAVGTAKGLAYLHDECLEWVLHCDVKPQNILLDKHFRPKVADFGLSKLFNRGGDIVPSFSKVRGTRGYMAPEWILNLPITSKVDVYSYGILVLELVTGRNSIGFQQIAEGVAMECRQLIPWIREMVRTRGDWMYEIADPSLSGLYDKSRMEMLVNVALQCVQEERDARPTMSQVVDSITVESQKNGEELSETTGSQINGEELAETAKSQINSEELAETIESQMNDEELAEIAQSQMNDEELAKIAQSQMNSEELAETAKSQINGEELAETAKSLMNGEELAEAIESQMNDEELAETAQSQMNSEELAETFGSQINGEELTETAKSQINVEELAETIESRVNDEELAETAQSQMNSEELAETIGSQINGEELAETAKSQINGEELAETIESQMNSEELAETTESQMNYDELAETKQMNGEELAIESKVNVEELAETAKSQMNGEELAETIESQISGKELAEDVE